MKPFYEWDVETYNAENDEVLDHVQDSLVKNLVPLIENANEHLVLVRDDRCGRSWAYCERAECGRWKLPEYFEDAFYARQSKVPAKYHRELERAQR